jgi:chromosome segregation ATPase
MSKTERAKGPQQKNDPSAPLDQVFSALEERVEQLSARLGELAEENQRLRGGLEEAEASRDRLKAELSESLERLGADSGARDRLAHLEDERESIRGRIERLIKNLEEAEAVQE